MDKRKLYAHSLTVGQLIQQLNRLPTDLPVVLEGCDCYGESKAVVQEASVVVITRR